MYQILTWLHVFKVYDNEKEILTNLSSTSIPVLKRNTQVVKPTN